MDLTVVIPVYNEVDNIRGLLGEVFGSLGDRVEFEVIVVDDGSTDNTPGVLSECRRDYEALRILHHRTCCGQSAAVCSGVGAAAAGVIATLDGDGQNDPADIPRLYESLQSSPDAVVMVVGYRRTRNDSRVKRLSSRVANSVRSALLGDETPDTGCGLKVFRRDAFLALPRFDHMHRFLPALVRREGGQVVSIEVNHRPRAGGTSKYGVFNRLWVGIVDMFGVKWLQRRNRRPQVTEL